MVTFAYADQEALQLSTLKGYVTVAYEENCWLGQVMKVDMNTKLVEFNFLHPKLPAKSYFYPLHQDILEHFKQASNVVVWIQLANVVSWVQLANEALAQLANEMNVSVSDVNVSVSDVNMSVSDVNVSVSDVNVSVSDVNVSVSDANVSVSDVNVSVSDVNVSVSDVNVLVNVSVSDAPVQVNVKCRGMNGGVVGISISPMSMNPGWVVCGSIVAAVVPITGTCVPVATDEAWINVTMLTECANLSFN
ncbi:hypothetical protein EMCRGX_G021775 [Ephydatia muelleri]